MAGQRASSQAVVASCTASLRPFTTGGRPRQLIRFATTAPTRPLSRQGSAVPSVTHQAVPHRDPPRAAPPTRPPSSSPSTPPKTNTSRRRLLQLLFWGSIAGLLAEKCVSVASVSGGSMSPTLNPLFPTHGVSAPRDLVILDRMSAARQAWQVGDVVVLASPSDPRILLTKRILALPGDVVRFMDTQTVPSDSGKGIKEVKVWSRVRVPPGHCWIEGDSSAAARPEVQTSTSSMRPDRKAKDASAGSRSSGVDLSQDSRHFGPVPLALLTAKVAAIVWPLQRAGSIAGRPGCAPTSFPGRAGANRSPFGTTSATDPDLSGSRAPEDSQLTPYVLDDRPGRGSDADVIAVAVGEQIAERIRFTKDIGETDQEARTEGDDQITEGRRPPLHVNVSSNDNQQKLRLRLNSLSRGGQLGESLG